MERTYAILTLDGKNPKKVPKELDIVSKNKRYRIRACRPIRLAGNRIWLDSCRSCPEGIDWSGVSRIKIRGAEAMPCTAAHLQAISGGRSVQYAIAPDGTASPAGPPSPKHACTIYAVAALADPSRTPDDRWRLWIRFGQENWTVSAQARHSVKLSGGRYLLDDCILCPMSCDAPMMEPGQITGAFWDMPGSGMDAASLMMTGLGSHVDMEFRTGHAGPSIERRNE